MCTAARDFHCTLTWIITVMNAPLFELGIISTIISSNVGFHSRTCENYCGVICRDRRRRCLFDDNSASFVGFHAVAVVADVVGRRCQAVVV